MTSEMKKSIQEKMLFMGIQIRAQAVPSQVISWAFLNSNTLKPAINEP
jgi:hypothetical protein